MPIISRSTFSSRTARKVYLALAACLLLFFLFNDFVLPWYVNAGGIVVVPKVVGVKFDDAKRLLDSIGLNGMKGEVRMDREHAAGTVILQNPGDGAKVKRGRRVYLAISGGELLAIVPNIKGRTLRDAKFSLEREGLRMGTIEYQSSDEYPPNTIIDQLTPTGLRVKRETFVSVVVSQGVVTEKIPIPDLYGKTLAEAQKILSGGYLKLGNITYVPSPDLLPNTIIQQFPHAGELVQNGQAVDLIIVQTGDKKKELFEN